MTPAPAAPASAAPTPSTQAAQQQDLLAELKDTVTSLLSDHVDDETQFEKMYQYLRLRKADYYYRGIQYIAPQLTASGSLDYSGVNTGQGADGVSRGTLDYNIDIVQTYGRKFIATLGQRPFYNLKCVPNDPQSDTDRKAAREGDKAYFLLRSWWDVKQKNSELAYHAWKSGTTFAYTRYVSDSNKYGYAEEPVIVAGSVVVEPAGYRCSNCGTKSVEPETIDVPTEDGQSIQVTQCPVCKQSLGRESYEQAVEASVPVHTGQTRAYANGQVELHLLNGFFVTVPFYGKDLQDLPFLGWDDEEHVGKLMALYPALREKYKDGGGFSVQGGMSSNDMMGTQARSAATSQIGMPRPQSKDKVMFRRTWVRPFMYELVKDEDKRELLKQHYPNGLKIIRVEKEVVDLANEKIEDYFGTMQPEVGDYIFRDGICWGVLQHQDAINDIWNQLVEILERTNTITLVDPEIIDLDALNDRPNMPMEWIAGKPGAGMSFDQGIKTLQSPKWPDQAPQMISTLKSAVESQTGVLPNLFGAGAPTQTAEQSRNELNQALMQLGTTGEFMIKAWVDAFTNGVTELARNSPKNLQVPSQPGMPGGDLIDLEVLQSGNWHFEGEMGIPRSYAERKDELKSLVNAQGPIAQQIAGLFGVTSPANIGVISDFLDLPDLKNPAQEMRDAMQDVINELSEGQPIQQPGPDGQMQTLPSAPLDWTIYDPGMFTELVRFWAVGTGRKLQQTPGYQNVMAAMQSAQQALAPPPPPGGPGGPPAPGGPQGQQGPPPQGGSPGEPPQPPPGPPPEVNNKQTPTGTALPPSAPVGPMAPTQ